MSQRLVLVFLMGTTFFVSCSAALYSESEGQHRLSLKKHPVTDFYEGWHLGTQAYTFKEYTFYEAVAKAEALGLNWIEAYPGQRLSKAHPDTKMNHNMPEALKRQVKRRLGQSRVKLVNYGVVGLGNDEVKCRKVFEFAKEMGIEIIVSEPAPEAMELVEKLCKEYDIKVAIHNHPKPSHYWHPDEVLEVCRGRSRLIGACADTGHWMRSGVRPLDAVRKLKGRIISFHLKDLNEFGNRDAHDVIWGTGKGGIKAILQELHRQNFKGVFSIEYEHHWRSSMPEIRKCVRYFNETAAELKATGWKYLLEGDLSNCVYDENRWEMKNGELVWKGAGGERSDIWTKETYDEFILDIEFKVAEHTNSGIFFRTAEIKDPVQTGIEIQVADTYGKQSAGKHDCGAIYDCLAPSKNMVKPAGEWNRCTVICEQNKIYVIMNGRQIIDMDLNRWTEANKNPDGTKNKFNTAYKDMPRKGHIGFQDHGRPVWYRNMMIKPL